MGIPSYFIHIVKNHRNILKDISINNIVIDNFYLDCNSLIYDAAQELNNSDINGTIDLDNKIINSVYNKLIYYINLIKPSNTIYIAFDGVAPVAKLNQQRNRRYKSWYQDKFLNDNTNNATSKIKWNTIVITPGTNFMNNLSKTISEKFNNPSKFNVNNIIVSASNIQGEGEHKIYQYIRDNSDYHHNTKTVIYGLDADLIMLTLNHLHIAPNMYLFRETPFFIKNIDNTLKPNNNYFMDIPLLANILSLELNNNVKLNRIQSYNKIYDYIFLCFFLGNDFLPHFPAINIRTNGIQRIINAYLSQVGKFNNNIINNSKISWKFLSKVIKFLSIHELEYIKDEYKIRKKWKNTLRYNSHKLEEQLNLIPLKDTSVEEYINPFEYGWEKRYYKELFDIDINDEFRKKICLNYLEGLEWTFKYYTFGCIDWRWSYNYNYPPLFCDLIKYIPYFDTTFLEIKKFNPVSPYVQLAYVLPRSYLNILPTKIFEELINQHNEWYSYDYNFKWAFCKYFWESHAVMPDINIHSLEKICN